MAKHGGRLKCSSNALKYHTTWIISSTVIPHHHCEARDCRKHSPGLRCAKVFAGNIPVFGFFGTHAPFIVFHSPLLFHTLSIDSKSLSHLQRTHLPCFPCHSVVAKPGSMPAAASSSALKRFGTSPVFRSPDTCFAVSRFRGARVMGIPMGYQWGPQK